MVRSSRRGRPPHDDVLTPTRVARRARRAARHEAIAKSPPGRGISPRCGEVSRGERSGDSWGSRTGRPLPALVSSAGNECLALQERPIMSYLTLGPLAQIHGRSGTSRSPRPGTARRSV